MNSTTLTFLYFVMLVVGFLGGTIPVQSAAADSDPPILYVHGIISSPGCPGLNTANDSAPLASVLSSNGYTGSVIGIDWECGDKGGVDIKPYGTAPASSYNATMPIETIAETFANYVWTEYSSQGIAVNVAAHSMGGLITEYAIKHHPELLINKVVSFSTPYKGIDKNVSLLGITCGGYVQCQEMKPNSTFLNDLNAIPKPDSEYLTCIGGGPGDIMTINSSCGTDANVKVDYYDKTVVNYNHTSYLTDTNQTENLKAKIDGIASVNQAHSLRMAWKGFS